MYRDRSVAGIRAHEGVTTEWAIRIIKAAAGIAIRAAAKIYDPATCRAAALAMAEIGPCLPLISPGGPPRSVVVRRHGGLTGDNYHQRSKYDL